MPNLPISQLPDISGSTLGYLSPDGEFAVAQSGVTYKVKSMNVMTGFAKGAFLSTNIQSASTTTSAYSMSADTVTLSSGVTVAEGSRFTVSQAGVYNLQFSAQIESTKGGSPETIDIWLSKNGTNVPDSNTQLSLNSNNGKIVAAWNFIESLNAGGYLEIKWSVSATEIQLVTTGIQTNPSRPSVPSVIVTMVQV